MHKAAGLKFNGVQALRFIAALLVVVTHSTLYASERLNGSVRVWDFGTIGVDIFFVISGFVMIVSTSRSAGSPDAWKFFGVRRLIRIVPMYWLATTVKLVTLFVLPVAVLHAEFKLGDTVLSYLFLPSRNADGAVEPLLGVGWTLIFEMFFYLVFTIALRLRANVLLFAGGVLTFFALGSIARPAGFDPFLVYFDPIVMYFLVGMVLARFALERSVRDLAIGLGFVVAVLTTVWLLVPRSPDLLGRGALSRALIVIALLLTIVVCEPWLGGRVPKPLLFMGDASYSLYLFHPLIAPVVPVVLARLGLLSGWLSVVLSVLAAVVSTTLIYRFVEKPMTRWLQVRIPYGSSRPRVAAGVPASGVEPIGP